jgi:hypothetical protein
MTKTRSLTLLAPALVAVLLGPSQAVLGQDKPSEKDLDRLLEKVEKAKSTGDKDKPAADEKKTEAKKPDDKKKDSEDKPSASADKKAPGSTEKKGELTSKDEALDNLLEKLGESKDAPSAKGRPAPPAGDVPKPAEPGKPARDGGLKGESKDLDEHLEEIAGKKRKKNQQEGDGSGPLADAIKQMREVEKRLSKPDTGEETRNKQGEIVKKLTTILEQLRNAQGQGQGQGRIRQVTQAGQPQGNRQGREGANPNANGVGPSKALRPNVKTVLANDKNTWGNLPPSMREEMSNVSKEEPLSKKAKLIERYYITVSKKALSKGE